jgi:hypothetical protein
MIQLILAEQGMTLPPMDWARLLGGLRLVSKAFSQDQMCRYDGRDCESGLEDSELDFDDDGHGDEMML